MRKSRLSLYKQNRLIEHFVAGTTARTASSLVGVNHKTAIYYFQRLRELIYHHDVNVEKFEGEIEVDESYFAGRRKGKRGRGAQVKCLYLAYLNAREGLCSDDCPMQRQKHS